MTADSVYFSSFEIYDRKKDFGGSLDLVQIVLQVIMTTVTNFILGHKSLHQCHKRADLVPLRMLRFQNNITRVLDVGEISHHFVVIKLLILRELSLPVVYLRMRLYLKEKDR